MKILIIWWIQIDENGSLGGVEKYNLNLINFLINKNYEIDFLYLRDLNEEGVKNFISKVNYIKLERKKKDYAFKLSRNRLLNVFQSCFYICLEQIKTNKDINNLNKFITKNKSKYSLIINNLPLYFRRNVRKLNKFFYVQHTDYKIYNKYFYYDKLDYGKYSFLYKNLLLMFNGAFLSNKNILKKTKNVVFYSDDKKYLEINKNALVGATPMELDFFKKESNWYINRKNKNTFVYFGRFDNESKNLKLLSDIAIYGNLNIDLYGYGGYDIELKKNYLLNLKGPIKTVDEKIEILSKYDIFLLTSNYEGICMSAIELLSMGVIGIIRNTFLEARNLIPTKHHGLLLINSNASIKEYIDKINFIKNLELNKKNEIRIDLMDHVKNNYHTKTFENNWNKILENNKLIE